VTSVSSFFFLPPSSNGRRELRVKEMQEKARYQERSSHFSLCPLLPFPFIRALPLPPSRSLPPSFLDFPTFTSLFFTPQQSFFPSLSSSSQFPFFFFVHVHPPPLPPILPPALSILSCRPMLFLWRMLVSIRISTVVHEMF